MSIATELQEITSAKNDLAQALISTFGVPEKDLLNSDGSIKVYGLKNSSNAIKRIKDWVVAVTSTSIDADTVDGKHANDFIINRGGISQSENIDNLYATGLYGWGDFSQFSGTLPNTRWGTLLVFDPMYESHYWSSQLLMTKSYIGYRVYDDGVWQNWERLAKASEIPTKVSQLTNDSGYITSTGSYLPISGGTITGGEIYVLVLSLILVMILEILFGYIQTEKKK